MITRKIDGQAYYVINNVPLVKAMVLNNARLDVNEIVKTLKAWNLKPVTFGHPKVNGNFVSAATEEVIKDHVGFVNNVRMQVDKMRGDLFLNKAKIDALPFGAEFIERVQRGDKIDVSTGYFDHMAEQESGIKDGKHYSYVQKNIAADHLAILLDEPGACSVNDGCGINVNKTKTGDTMSESKKADDLNVNQLAKMADAIEEMLESKLDEKLGELKQHISTNSDKTELKALSDRIEALELNAKKDVKAKAKADEKDAEDEEETESEGGEEEKAMNKKKDKPKKMVTNAFDKNATKEKSSVGVYRSMMTVDQFIANNRSK